MRKVEPVVTGQNVETREVDRVSRIPSPAAIGWRSGSSALDDGKPVELRAFLRTAGGGAITETWSYLLPPIDGPVRLELSSTAISTRSASRRNARADLLARIRAEAGDARRRARAVRRAACGARRRSGRSRRTRRAHRSAARVALAAHPRRAARAPRAGRRQGLAADGAPARANVDGAAPLAAGLVGSSPAFAQRKPHDVPDSPPERGRWRRARCRGGAALLVLLIVGQTYLATDLMVAILPYHGRQPLEIAILDPVRDPVRLDLGRLLDGARRLPRAGARRRPLRRSRAPRATTRRSRPTRAPRSSCRSANEDVAARVRAACARPTSRSRARRTARALRLLRAVRYRESRHARRRGGGVVRRCAASIGFGRIFYRWRAAPDQAQERQRRRLLPPLGQALPLHDRARRRQRDERRVHPRASCRSPRRTPTPASSRRRRARPGATRSSRACSSSRRGVYGPLFTAGLHFWQLGESHYWGHNAIIRVAPFIHHCALAACRARATARARSCRTTSSRRR